MDRRILKQDIKQPLDILTGNIQKHFHLDGLFLFGSFARGDERRDSDLDLVVLSRDFEDMDFIARMEMLSHIHGSTRETASVSMDLIGYTPEEFETIDQESVIMRQAKKEGYFVWKKEPQ